MKKNFKIVDYIAIETDNRYFDLHNDAELKSYHVDYEKAKCVLTWQIASPGIKETRLEISFLDILLLNSHMNYSKENGTLLFAGYVTSEDFGVVVDRFIPEEESNDDDHVIFAFDDGSNISIKCAEMRADVFQ